MKNTELAMVGLIVSMAGYGGFSLGASSNLPAPAPVSLTINMPPGVVEISAPLLEMDCDRDPEVMLSGANITMHGSDAPAISVETRGE